MVGEVMMQANPVLPLAVEKRLRNIYRRHGANAARGLAEKILHRRLNREELRFLLWLERDDEGYAQAVEAHRLAWEQAGWNGRVWYQESIADGNARAGKGGGRSSIQKSQAFAAKPGQ